MIDDMLDRLPSMKMLWVLFIPIAMAIISINTIIAREQAPDHPVAAVEIPREWRLPPGIALGIHDFSEAAAPTGDHRTVQQ